MCNPVVVVDEAGMATAHAQASIGCRSEVGATKATAHRGNVGSGCVRCEVTLDRVTSGTILVLNNTNRDEAKRRLAILTCVEE